MVGHCGKFYVGRGPCALAKKNFELSSKIVKNDPLQVFVVFLNIQSTETPPHHTSGNSRAAGDGQVVPAHPPRVELLQLPRHHDPMDRGLVVLGL